MVKHVETSRLKYQAQFCPVKMTENPISGAKTRSPDKDKGKFHYCGIYNFSLYQKLNSSGNDLTNELTLIVRHGLNIDDSMYVIFQNKAYLIDQITYDDSGLVTYDLVSLKEGDGSA